MDWASSSVSLASAAMISNTSGGSFAKCASAADDHVFSDLRSRAGCCTGTDLAVRAVRPVDGALRLESTAALGGVAELEGLNWAAELEVNMMKRP
jgi:hypothetical protein